ncbi:MAG: type I DNA topoisomerase [Bacteroidales bacterium]|nr:type I DNA topoisomerase [Bacteroidales bacterium]
MKNLVIVESPGKIGKIQNYLGSDYKVLASYGHIRDLDDKKLSIDIEHGFAPQYIIPQDKSRVIANLKAAAAQAETVYLASDEDREGEAISWHLFETLGLKKENTKRIVFHEITKDAILEAVKHPRDINMKLVDAQQARRVLDRLVGFELSPVLWRKVQPKLSAGRVQSVALRLVVDREREILSSANKMFYRVEGEFSSGIKAYIQKKFLDMEAGREVLESLIGAEYKIGDIVKSEGFRYPAPPFTTSTLQQEASRKLRMSVKRTMDVAQSLYEKGLITYMRTDSTTLSSLALSVAKQYIKDTFGEEYYHYHQYKTTSKSAQEAHEAIRPTYLSNPEITGTAEEKALYDLIFKRTIASQMAPAKVENTEIKIVNNLNDHVFVSNGQIILFDGFRKVYMEGRDDEDQSYQPGEVILPSLAVGQSLSAKQISANASFDTPVYRYSEATLVKKLEELGIGRPSTYAPTITTLTKGRGYIVKGNKEGEKLTVTNLVLSGTSIKEKTKNMVLGAEKGKLLPQEIGIIVTDYLVANFTDVLDYNFTAAVENDFDKVAEGQIAWTSLIENFYGPFHGNVTSQMENGEYQRVSRSLGIDPKSGKEVSVKFGKYGPYVQIGDADDKIFASLEKGQIIESLTLEDALKLFAFPRVLGQRDGADVTVNKGRYGAYVKCGNVNASLPKGKDPLNISLEEALELLTKKNVESISEFGPIKVIDGRYGPYISYDGKNYKIPPKTDPKKLSEEDCRKIINNSKNKSK